MATMPCKLAACQIERKFAEELVEIGFQAVHNSGHKGMVSRGECTRSTTVEEATTLPPTTEAGGSHDEFEADTFFSCCGEYPERFPFLDGGTRVCCGDGRVRFEGNC